MATDLETRKSTSKSEAFLRRKFAELCARVRRIDVIASLLMLALAVAGYALLMGVFDRLVGAEAWVDVVRWTAYVVFHLAFLGLLTRTIRCGIRRVNPYFVAHELEQTLPDGKNSLINWLDLNEQDLPAAFRKNLSTNAAEQFKESEIEQTIPTRKNWFLLGSLTVPIIVLLVLLILGPAAFAASMRRAFLPFLDTGATRTQITLLQPGRNVDVSANQSITFAAKIEGRVPASNRADAPRLLYRYQPNEEFLSQPLSADGNGVFTTQMVSTQLRTGFNYKIAAGDAATDEYQVRVRARAHVKSFEVTYQHRPYRKLGKTTATFPNQHARVPVIHGQRGTEVELLVRASRPVDKATVEIVADKVKSLPITKRSADSFSCYLTLEQSGQFRVTFTSVDGEENTDRELYDIVVVEDETPRVTLTLPGKDTALPLDGTLELEGVASDDVGLKNLTLHMRVANGESLQPKLYRAGKSFQRPDGTYPDVIEYLDFVGLNQLKDAKGRDRFFDTGTVLEYWLEATDNADYPQPNGNAGKSAVFKLTLLSALKDPKQKEAQRQRAQDKQKKHEKKQDERISKENKDRQENAGGSSGSDPQQQANDLKNDKKDKETKDKLDKAMNDQKNGGSQGDEQNPGENKPGPPKAGEGPQPHNKDQKPMPGSDPGNSKPGDDKGAMGESRDSGDGMDKESPGESKEGPNQPTEPARGGGPMAEPAGGVKDGGSMDMNAPPMPTQKEAGMGAPMPTAKDNGPPSDSQGPKGEAKQDASKKGNDSTLDNIATLLEKLPQPGAEGEKAGQDLADIGKKAGDERMKDLAKEILDKNGRDPETGKEKKKGPNLFGSGGKSDGISDEVKAAAANREFARRIGSMQLDNWKKRMTPDLLKKAGVTAAEWERYVKNQQAYDALVRQLNAKKTMAQVRAGRPPSGIAATVLEPIAPSNDPLESGRYQPPPELRDAQRRFSTKQP